MELTQEQFNGTLAHKVGYTIPVKILKGQAWYNWWYAHDEKIKNIWGDKVDGISKVKKSDLIKYPLMRVSMETLENNKDGEWNNW